MFGPCAGDGPAFGEAPFGAMPRILTADDPAPLVRVERPGFNGPRLPEAAPLASAVRAAAEAAREAGGEGVLVDLGWASPCWNATGAGASASAMRTSAQRLGAALSDAAVTAYPDGAVVLVLGPDILAAGPLGLPFLTGLLEGRGADIHLLLEVAPETTLESLRDAHRRARATIALHAASSGADRLRMGCWLSEAADTGGPARFRARLAAAQLASDAYVYLDASGDRLAERGWELRTPLEGMIRAGEISFQGTQAFALRTPSGAGIVPVTDLAAFAMQRPEPLTVVHLGDGEPAAYETGEDGAVSLPALAAPTLIDGFAMNEILPSAALVARADPWDPAESRHTLEFGVVNETGLRIDGLVQCIAPLGYAVTPADHPVALESGERAIVRAHLAGQPNPGDTVSLRLVLSMPGVKPAARTVHIAVLPEERWRAENPAAVVAGPRAVGEAPHLLLWSHAFRGLAAVSPDGVLRWETETPAAAVLPPASGSQWHGLPQFVTAGADGFLHAYDPAGNPLWRWATEPPAPIAAMTTASLHASPGAEWAVIGGGALHVLSAQGARLRTVPMDGDPVHLAAMPGAEGFDALAVAFGGAEPRILALDRAGATLWTHALAGPPYAAPVYTEHGLFAPDGATLTVLDPESGAAIAAVPAVAGPLLAAVPLVLDGEPAALLATSSHVECRRLDGEPLWSVLIGTAFPPAVSATANGLRIAVAGLDDVLYLLDESGAVLWEDSRAAHAFAGPPCFVQSEDAGHLAVQASRDGFVRALRIDAAPLANRAARP